MSASQTGSEKGGAGVPTYQYTCTDCGEPLEVVQKFTDDALIECPQCGGKLRKVYSGVGIVFKGSGFYRTDSRSSDTAATPPAETAKTDKSEKAAASTSSSDSGSSSTPAAPASPPSTPKSTPAPSSTPASGGSGGKAASS